MYTYDSELRAISLGISLAFMAGKFFDNLVMRKIVSK